MIIELSESHVTYAKLNGSSDTLQVCSLINLESFKSKNSSLISTKCSISNLLSQIADGFLNIVISVSKVHFNKCKNSNCGSFSQSILSNRAESSVTVVRVGSLEESRVILMLQELSGEVHKEWLTVSEVRQGEDGKSKLIWI